MAASPQIIKKGRGWRRGLCRRVVKGKVLKMDGPSAQGFLSLTGPLAPRVADCRSAAMLIKSALRDWLYESYSLIRILLTGSLRSPPPIRAAPDFPLFRGQNKTPRNNLPINPPLEMTVLASSIQSFQKGTNDKNAAPHPRHFDRSEAEWRNLPL